VATQVINAQSAPDRKSVSFSPRFVSSLVGLCDGLVLFGSSLAIFLIYVGWSHQNYPAYLLTIAINAGLMVTVFYLAGLYKFDAIKNPRQQINVIFLVSVAVFLALVGLAFALKISSQFSRVWAFSSWGVGLSLICITRLCAYYYIYRWAKAGLLTRNIAILGAGEHGRRLVEEIQRLDEPWNTVVGVFDDRSTRTLSGSVGYSVMGTVEDLCRFERDNRVDEIIVALPWSAHDRLHGVIEKIRELPVRVRVGPDFIGLGLSRHGYRCSTFCDAPTLDVIAKPITGWGFILKLLEDRLIGGLLIVLFIPLMLLIAALIKLDSRGPVLFRQNRYGFNNQVFQVLKFRTMYHLPCTEENVPQAQRDDPRVTRVGRWLRSASLDELPQLFNVIQGTMSLVGPRPHAVPHNQQYAAIIAGYYARHRTKPGMTGWAQVKGFRGETETPDKMKARVELDIYYVEHWSLLFDLEILAMTPFAVFAHKNAY